MLNINYSPRHKGSWYQTLLDTTKGAIKGNSFWEDFLDNRINNVNLHLGIFVDPYIQLILDGEKTLESRFSVNRTAPYNKANKGDVLLLKQSSGPIIGICQIIEVSNFILTTKLYQEIKEKHEKDLCIQSPDFWKKKEKSKYATLMKIQNIACFKTGINFIKKDRRGWIILNSKFTL